MLINQTIQGYNPTGDGIEFITLTGNLILTSYHRQDCCEDVDADWDEIPNQLLENLLGIFCTTFEIESVPDTGFIMHFNHPPQPNELPEEYWICRQSVLVCCHDNQNGYYSSNLTITASFNEQLTQVDVSSKYTEKW